MEDIYDKLSMYNYPETALPKKALNFIQIYDLNLQTGNRCLIWCPHVHLRKLAAERDEIHRRWGEQHQRMLTEHQKRVNEMKAQHAASRSDKWDGRYVVVPFFFVGGDSWNIDAAIIKAMYILPLLQG